MEVIKEKHDYKNRKRYLTMVYSVSKDEQREIYARINLTGRKIQDYMYQSTVHGSIVIAGNEIAFIGIHCYRNGSVDMLLF